MNYLHRIISYLRYLVRSFHLHGVHSPFVFGLINNIIRDKSRYYAFDQIESIKAKLILSNQKIKFKDFGAKYKDAKELEKNIADIAKSSSQTKKHAEILFKIARHFQANTILELGTSFGIGTAYLAMQSSKSKVISLEGSENIAKIAKLNHEKLEIKNVEIRVGEFNTTLSKALSDLSIADLIYFDGNHTEEATLNYFNECLYHKNEKSIFIFDDIYWSKGMTKAWNTIKAHPEVTVTVDLYKIGIVFFKKDQAKENFTVYH